MNFEMLAGCFLHLPGQLRNLIALLVIGRRHYQCQQMVQRIRGNMHLAATLFLAAVITGPVPAFRRGAKGAATEDDGGRLRLFALGHPQQFPQVMDDRLKVAGMNQALHLLVDGRPGRQVMGHQPPSAPGLGHLA